MKLIFGVFRRRKGDALSDGWEAKSGMDPLDPADAGLDFDNDGLDNMGEYCFFTDPFNPDTDGDGVSDGDEVPGSAGSCPTDPDDKGDPANCVTLSLGVYLEYYTADVGKEPTPWEMQLQVGEAARTPPNKGSFLCTCKNKAVKRLA